MLWAFVPVIFIHRAAYLRLSGLSTTTALAGIEGF